mgnify:FL=1
MTTKKKGSAIVDMTVGSPTALILGFAIPMLLGTLFQQFYSMADTVIVGRFLSVQALAGVGSTAAINFLINGFVIGMSSGFAIPVAQRFGARDYVDMRKFIANTIWLSLIFSVVVTGLVALFTKQLLILTQTPEDILPYAYQYIFIIFLGIPTTYLYNVTASLIRALGDSKTPVYFLILASVVNIVLDFVSIVGFGFSVNGPALATVFSQAVSGICCIFYMRKKFPLLRFAPREMQFDARKCGILLSMALPMGLQYSITAIGSVILQSAVNMLGTVTVASVTAGQKISMFFCCVYDALGATMATYAGQNVGAGKLQRVQDGVYVATRIGIAYGLLAFLICFLFGNQLPLLFLSPDQTEIVRQARLFLLANSAFYAALAIVNIWRFTIQGMGYSGFAILSGVSEMIARTLVGFFGVRFFGIYAVFFASPLAWLSADCFLIPAFHHCLRKLRLLIGIRED